MTLWRDIVDSLSDPIIVVSEKLELRALNPAAEALLGAARSSATLIIEVLRRNKWLEKMLAACLAGGEAVSDAQTVLQLPARKAAVAVEVSPLLTQDGRVQGAVILMHDRARQLQIEQSFDTTTATDLGMSPAGLAHEVKNPLTGIKGAAELLISRFQGEKRAQQYCDVILNGVNRIATLVEQVLSVSGPQKLKTEPVNIHRVLHQSLALAGLYPKSPPSLKIEQHFDPSLPNVIGDESALIRVFLNLVKNASEAINGTGTIRLTTRMETDFRSSTAGQHRRFMRIEISDSGPGLKPEDFSQLFKPFFTSKPSGTGLGLVLSQRIIALHGGRLWAELGRKPQDGNEDTKRTDIGDGSPLSGITFKVTLPVIIAPKSYSSGLSND